MRFMNLFMAAVAFMVAFSMLAMSGAGAVLGAYETGGAVDQLNETAASAENEEGHVAIALEPGEGESAGMLGDSVASLRGISGVFNVIFRTPTALEAMGAPGWAATIAGRVFQIFFTLGMYQLLRGMEVL